jgi:hypothetical protein
MKLFKAKKIICLTIIIGFFLMTIPMSAQKKPEKLFPDFGKQKEEMGKIHVLGDFLHLQDIKGKTDVFKLAKNNKLWELFIANFKSSLEKRNYKPEKISLTSAGLYLDQEKVVYLELTAEDEKLKNTELKKGTAPFFVDESVENNPEFKENLTAFYKKLFEYEKKSGDANITIPEVQAVVQGTDCETLFVVHIVGRSIGTGRMIAGAAVGGLAGYAIIGSAKGVFYNLYIIDVKSGELIWAHKNRKKKFTKVNKAAMKKVSQYLTKHLPYKVK